MLLRREQLRNTALRFRFTTLLQRYNTLQQYWARTTREIENGTYRRDVRRAAQRFGEKEALTILGKRKAEMYVALAAAQGKKGHDEAEVALDAADLIDGGPDVLDDARLVVAGEGNARAAEPDEDLEPTPPFGTIRTGLGAAMGSLSERGMPPAHTERVRRRFRIVTLWRPSRWWPTQGRLPQGRLPHPSA